MIRKQTMDGNTAAAYISYAFTEVSAIYPITPSSPMSDQIDEWVAKRKKNIFGQPVKIVEMQSEAGAAGSLHGTLQAGVLGSTYTSSQGLLLMIPNMYKMVGERLPAVIHVASRAIASSALSIFGDHQDVMASRQTGFAILAEGSPQEVMDLSPVAHLAAIKSRVPFINFFDGFRVSHEIQKVETISYDDLKGLVDEKALREFRERGLNPDSPVTRGSSQNPDTYFQMTEALNKYYEDVPTIVEEYMGKIKELTGREYHCFDYYGDEEADRIIIAMGSVTEIAEEAIDYLRANGEKVGVVKVRLYRPFSIEMLLKAIPSTVKKIAVLDRTKEQGSIGEPLYLDILRAVNEMDNIPKVYGGRYGLGSKDVFPRDIVAVYENLNQDKPVNSFTIGIEDDVTNLSLKSDESLEIVDDSITSCKFYGLGSDGTVGANKSAIKIIGDNTDKEVQAYFSYDSKKSGGITISNLRFGDKKIRSHYEVNEANFIACHNQSYINKYDILKGLKKNGTFLLNTIWTEEELERKLSNKVKRYLSENNINFYVINAIEIARQVGLGGRINMIMQSVFFKLANIIEPEQAIKYLKEAVVTAYERKGEKIVNMNFEAIDKALTAYRKIEVKEEWKTLQDENEKTKNYLPDFVREFCEPINNLEGNSLKVSDFIKHGVEDGTLMHGTTHFEKRGIATSIPEWVQDKCIQCNQCAYVCPHACIRPFLATSKEVKSAPKGYKSIKANGISKDGPQYQYTIGITPLDCTGCNSCVEACPAPGKALVMKPVETQDDQIEAWDYAVRRLKAKPNPTTKTTVKGSQFEEPLLEFSGACAGCGETPYAKLVTQLFGDRMMIANATGCSTIWAASGASTSYKANKNGNGPAWANSLFEDNAEFGFGMHLGVEAIRERLEAKISEALSLELSPKEREAMQTWLDNKDKGENSRVIADRLIAVLEESDLEIAEEILKDRYFLVKRSQWIFGGDGWAYDIGFGGLDHVLASGENVNVLVFDTEIYSNTGGQSSKATPQASVAKFATTGKTTKKKDLGLMAMTYGNVYVAQISMGANMNQTIKALVEAENYNGPSLIIAYATCIAHGIKLGMGSTPYEEKIAVDSGYWSLYRYNPDLKEEGKNPFILDSKQPHMNIRNFLMGEVRYSSLAKTNPKEAEEMFVEVEKEAKDRYNRYKTLSENIIF